MLRASYKVPGLMGNMGQTFTQELRHINENGPPKAVRDSLHSVANILFEMIGCDKVKFWNHNDVLVAVATRQITVKMEMAQ